MVLTALILAGVVVWSLRDTRTEAEKLIHKLTDRRIKARHWWSK
jgi:hypothetical protein